MLGLHSFDMSTEGKFQYVSKTVTNDFTVMDVKSKKTLNDD